jgi:hypothetical protein
MLRLEYLSPEAGWLKSNAKAVMFKWGKCPAEVRTKGNVKCSPP